MNAFPSTRNPTPQERAYGSHEPIVSPGMTLRDYFAAKAIVECIRVAEHQTPHTVREPKLSELFAKAAIYAYSVADAMLAAREKS